MDINEVVAKNLTRLMDKYGLTQRGLAIRSGLAQKTISNILNCVGSTSINRIHTLAQYFQIPSWALLVPDMPIDKGNLSRATAALYILDRLPRDSQDAVMRYISEQEIIASYKKSEQDVDNE